MCSELLSRIIRIIAQFLRPAVAVVIKLNAVFRRNPGWWLPVAVRLYIDGSHRSKIRNHSWNFGNLNYVAPKRRRIVFNILFLRNEQNVVSVTRLIITVWDLNSQLKENIFLLRIKISLLFFQVIRKLQRFVSKQSSIAHRKITAFSFFTQTEPVRKRRKRKIKLENCICIVIETTLHPLSLRKIIQDSKQT